MFVSNLNSFPSIDLAALLDLLSRFSIDRSVFQHRGIVSRYEDNMDTSVVVSEGDTGESKGGTE